MRDIIIFDTTLRDGEQSPGVNLNVHEKLQIAKQLAQLGVDAIEAGFPKASPGDFAAVKEIADNVQGPIITALARAVAGDIELAAKAVAGAKRKRIHTFIAASPIHMRYKLRKTPAEVLKMTRNAVRLAASLVSDVEFSAEDATRSDWDFLCEVYAAAIAAGAGTINIPDTVGYTTPVEYSRLIAYILENTPGIEKAVISVHCHDDLGMATANSLAAVMAGATQVECTINGLGERAGNAALEEIVMALATRGDVYQARTNIVTEQIARTSRLVSTLTGVAIQPNKAIVGENAFAHESGIHQDGVLKERSTYEIITPESIGLSQGRLVLGKHSGRHAFRQRLIELGYNLGDADAEKAYERFISLCDRKKTITDRDLEAIVDEQIVQVEEEFALEYLAVTTGSSMVPTATVRVRHGADVLQEAACGDGPVDACYKAIDRVTQIETHLVSYALGAVTGGKDALGEVTVQVRDNGHLYAGRGTSTDVIEASVRAYLQAINKMIQARKSAQPEG
ncbi:MAG TPA: 2-isopropylmalate synthase [Firmicutes bacterium]|jgi:2-isopropylmalate synthase|nr:2-isopropylmalate synthase [Bacillota bacterium]